MDGILTKCSSCHSLGVNGGLWICSWKVWSGVVPALVVVILDVEASELGEADSQSTASIVDVLSIQRLKEDNGPLRCAVCFTFTSLVTFNPVPTVYKLLYNQNAILKYANLSIKVTKHSYLLTIGDYRKLRPMMQKNKNKIKILPSWHAVPSWHQHTGSEPGTGCS